MRLTPRSRTSGIAVFLAAVAVLVAVVVTIVASSVGDRLLVGLALIAAAAGAGAVLGATGYARGRRSQHAEEELERDTVEAWFESPSLGGFPARALSELRPGIAQAEVLRLQTAWLLATQGHDEAWLIEHFGLPSDVARLLVDSANRSGRLPRR